jgi:hypothetical protein
MKKFSKFSMNNNNSTESKFPLSSLPPELRGNIYSFVEFELKDVAGRDRNPMANIREDRGNRTYLNGRLHSFNDRPALIDDFGNIFWYRFGLLHRGNNLPAIIWADGTREWRIDGRYIRSESPS